MTKDKRFTIIRTSGEIGVKENRSGDVIVLMHDDLNSEQFVSQIVGFLNDQDDCIKKLVKDAKYYENKAIEIINKLEKENRKLKSDYKILVEYVHEKIVDETDVNMPFETRRNY